LLVMLALAAAGPALANDDHNKAGATPVSGNEPVTFLADRVTYDKTNGIVTAEGHVQAWQNDHYMAADRVTFDRNTGVAAGHGHVVIVEPDGEIVFGDYAEVSQGMKNGILTGMRAYLANGGKLAANGSRRTEGKLNEMSRAVYSACNLCALHPERAPEWQLRADHMTQDLEHKRIEYSDAWLDVFGFPLVYLPYMSNTDPSVKRQSGLLVPSFGATSSHLGAFLTLPYYYVLDDQSDLTVTPEFSSQQGGDVTVEYRNWMDNGRVDVTGAVGRDSNTTAAYLFGNANFVWDDTWRYGTSVNVANSAVFLRDYEVTPGFFNFLPTTAYIEGFGVGSYTKLDAAAYQGINTTVQQDTLPYVLPRYSYSFFSQPVFLGGRFEFDTMAFDVLREIGTSTRRVAARAAWERPFAGLLGEQYELTASVAAAGYQANVLNGEPTYGNSGASTTAHAEPQVALKINWPFVRDAGTLGTQIVEPILQLIGGPQSGNSLHDRLPNEDSLDYEFTDATLFSQNRFGGYDRFDGGARANFALHGNWTFKGGQALDALVGASAIEHVDQNLYPQFQPWNGFERGKHLSDVVGRATLTVNKWVSFTARARVDHDNGDLRFADTVLSVGPPVAHGTIGYFYASTNPYTLYLTDYFAPNTLLPNNLLAANFFTPRSDIGVGFGSKIGAFTASLNAHANVQTQQMDSASAHLRWEDECTALDMLLQRRYTSILGDHGSTSILFTITLKTVGQIPIE
jgi:LPS-assembly protein